MNSLVWLIPIALTLFIAWISLEIYFTRKSAHIEGDGAVKMYNPIRLLDFTKSGRDSRKHHAEFRMRINKIEEGKVYATLKPTDLKKEGDNVLDERDQYELVCDESQIHNWPGFSPYREFKVLYPKEIKDLDDVISKTFIGTIIQNHIAEEEKLRLKSENDQKLIRTSQHGIAVIAGSKKVQDDMMEHLSKMQINTGQQYRPPNQGEQGGRGE